MANYKVTVLPSDQTFLVNPGELVLDAAIRQGVRIPYSCRNGTCRSCLHAVKEGSLRPVDVADCMITEQELESGRRLLCMSVCESDAVVEKVLPRKRQALENSEAERATTTT